MDDINLHFKADEIKIDFLSEQISDFSSFIRDFKLKTADNNFKVVNQADKYLFEYKMDSNWYGQLFDSFYSPRQAYTEVPRGFYHPSDLGLDLPKCDVISIGLCSILDYFETKKKWTWRGPVSYTELPKESRYQKTNPREIAHAHGSYICMQNGLYVFRDRGVPDDVIWHEYAHILADCDKHGHDEVWVKIAKSLGLVNPTPHTSYEYYGPPKVEWKAA